MSNWIFKRQYNFSNQKGNRNNWQCYQSNNYNHCYSYYDHLYPKEQCTNYNDTSYHTENENSQLNYYATTRHNNNYPKFNQSNQYDYNWKTTNNNNNNSKVSKQPKHSFHYQGKFISEIHDEKNQAQYTNGFIRNCIKKRRIITKKEVNNNSDVINQYKGTFSREEILKVKIQLNNSVKEIIVYKNDDPFQLARIFVEMNSLSLHLINPLSIQLTTAILKINQLLHSNLNQDNIDLLNKVKFISSQTTLNTNKLSQ